MTQFHMAEILAWSLGLLTELLVDLVKEFSMVVIKSPRTNLEATLDFESNMSGELCIKPLI